MATGSHERIFETMCHPIVVKNIILAVYYLHENF